MAPARWLREIRDAAGTPWVFRWGVNSPYNKSYVHFSHVSEHDNGQGSINKDGAPMASMDPYDPRAAA